MAVAVAKKLQRDKSTMKAAAEESYVEMELRCCLWTRALLREFYCFSGLIVNLLCHAV